MNIFELAAERLKKKGEEHNTETITFDDYCPFGDASAATFVHREALRVCALVERGAEDEAVIEHLVDTAVFCQLMYSKLTGEAFSTQLAMGIGGSQLVEWLTNLGVKHQHDEHGFQKLTTIHLTNKEINEARKGNLIIDEGVD